MTKHSASQKIIAILIITHLIGCTSMQRIEADPGELQDRIRNDNIVIVGDNVKTFTEDGKEYQFEVTAIDAEAIRGEHTTVPVDSIIALETQEISIGKTSLLTGGVAGVAFLIAIAIAPALILAASAP
ncbi:MAG: hypothetical protein V2J55_17640 [Candidatus Competibacteraceae bacterium]|jgi:hypothetical protein|nr:hypothetical protein [Candidatus Competibacteraceae bacterium]